MHAARGETVPPHLHYCPECNVYSECYLGCDDVDVHFAATEAKLAHGPSAFCDDTCARLYRKKEDAQGRRREAIRRLSSPSLSPEQKAHLAGSFGANLFS